MSRLKYFLLNGDPYKKEKYPEEITVPPTIKEYSKGFFYRYFVQPKSDLVDIKEIDKPQYDSYNESGGGINKNLYNAVKMKWRIRGQAHDVYKGETRIVPGVWESNKRITQLKESHIPGLSQKLLDYMKYATIKRDVENPTGVTSEYNDHYHMYNIDSDGNGWALESFNPKNPNIKHKHKIVNWEVQEAQSDCYPNCKMMYGHEGAGPHTHTISSRGDSTNGY